MKRVWVLMLALLMLLVVSACGSEKSDVAPAGKEPVKEEGAAEPEKAVAPAEDDKAESAGQEAGFDLNVNGVDIAMEAEAGPVLEALGEYESVFDMDSCAGLGTMRYYSYPGFELGTYEMEGRGELIYSLMFTNDLMETAEGILLGSTPAEAKAAYEGEYTEDGSALKIDRGNCRLSIISDENAVTMIEYVSLAAIGMSCEE